MTPRSRLPMQLAVMSAAVALASTLWIGRAIVCDGMRQIDACYEYPAPVTSGVAVGLLVAGALAAWWRGRALTLHTILIVLAAGGMVYFALFFETTVQLDDHLINGVVIPGEAIYNTGLLAQRQNGLIISCVMLIVGVILFAARSRARNT